MLDRQADAGSLVGVRQARVDLGPAVAFAVGPKEAVALNCSVSYLRAPSIGGTLRAESREVSLSRRIGTYFIEVRNTDGQLIATCDAMAYRKPDPLPFLHG